MRYRIESDGTPHGTRVTDLETGSRLRGVRAIKILPFSADDHLVRAQIELLPVELDMQLEVELEGGEAEVRDQLEECYHLLEQLKRCVDDRAPAPAWISALLPRERVERLAGGLRRVLGKAVRNV